jgi:hypothetical protein
VLVYLHCDDILLRSDGFFVRIHTIRPLKRFVRRKTRRFPRIVSSKWILSFVRREAGACLASAVELGQGRVGGRGSPSFCSFVFVAQGTWGPSLGLQTLFPLRPEDGRAAAAAATSVTPPLALLALALAPEQP